MAVKNQVAHSKSAVNIWFIISFCTMSLCRIAKITIASVNSHRRVAQVTDFYVID